VAAHLSIAAARSHKTLLLDLDVEAPDSPGYFPGASKTGSAEAVSVMVPSLSNPLQNRTIFVSFNFIYMKHLVFRKIPRMGNIRPSGLR